MTDTVNVPREPTLDMTMAGAECLPSVDGVSGLAGALSANVYRAMLAAAPKDEPVSDPDKSESYWFDPRAPEVTDTNPDNILCGYYAKFDVTMIQCGDVAMFGFWYEPADGSGFQYRYFSDRDQAEAEVKGVQASIRALRSQPEAPKGEPVTEIPNEFWSWLKDRDLAPDTDLDGTVDWLDIISALNEHENELMSHPAPSSEERFRNIVEGFVNSLTRNRTIYERGLDVSHSGLSALVARGIAALDETNLAKHKGPQS